LAFFLPGFAGGAPGARGRFVPGFGPGTPLRFWPGATATDSEASTEGCGDVPVGDDPLGVAPVVGVAAKDSMVARSSGLILSFAINDGGAGFALGFGPGFLRCFAAGAAGSGGAAMADDDVELPGEGGRDAAELFEDFAAATMFWCKGLWAGFLGWSAPETSRQAVQKKPAIWWEAGNFVVLETGRCKYELELAIQGRGLYDRWMERDGVEVRKGMSSGGWGCGIFNRGRLVQRKHFLLGGDDSGVKAKVW